MDHVTYTPLQVFEAHQRFVWQARKGKNIYIFFNKNEQQKPACMHSWLLA